MVFSHTLHTVLSHQNRKRLEYAVCMAENREHHQWKNAYCEKKQSAAGYTVYNLGNNFFLTSFSLGSLKFLSFSCPVESTFCKCGFNSKSNGQFDWLWSDSFTSLSHSLSFFPFFSLSLSHSVCRWAGITVHVAVLLLRLLFRLMTEHVFSAVYFGESVCVRTWVSLDLSEPIVSRKKINNNNNKMGKKRTNLFGIYSLCQWWVFFFRTQNTHGFSPY